MCLEYRDNFQSSTKIRAEDIDAALIEFVKAREHVSFVELQNFAEQIGVPARGAWAIHPDGFDRIIYWLGLSGDLYGAVRRLIASRQLYFHRATPFSYLADGAALALPLAQTGLETFDCWLPVVLCSYPYQKASAA